MSQSLMLLLIFSLTCGKSFQLEHVPFEPYLVLCIVIFSNGIGEGQNVAQHWPVYSSIQKDTFLQVSQMNLRLAEVLRLHPEGGSSQCTHQHSL